jgi:hypothetical protein
MFQLCRVDFDDTLTISTLTLQGIIVLSLCVTLFLFFATTKSCVFGIKVRL